MCSALVVGDRGEFLPAYCLRAICSRDMWGVWGEGGVTTILCPGNLNYWIVDKIPETIPEFHFRRPGRL